MTRQVLGSSHWGPCVLVVTAEDPPKCVENGFELERSVNDRKGALPQRRHQLTDILPIARLPRPHHDGRRGLIEPAEQLEDARTAGRGSRPCAAEWDFQIHYRNMDRLMLDQRGRFFARISLHRMNAHGFEQLGQLTHRGMLPPAPIGKQQVEAGIGMGSSVSHEIREA